MTIEERNKEKARILGEFMNSAEYTDLPQVCRDHLFVVGDDGRVRFRPVKFYQVLNYDVDLNRLWRECRIARVPMVYLAEYYMGIGYSVLGFWELFEKYVDVELKVFKEFGQ